MKILIATTLVVCTAITVVHQKQLRAEQHLAKHARVAEAGRLWGVKEEAKYWKGMAQRMVREVECIPLVGGPENRKYNRHEDPSSVVNDPGRFWYS